LGARTCCAEVTTAFRIQYEMRADGLHSSRRSSHSVVPPSGYSRCMYDDRYKTVFAFRRMVKDLLRGFVVRTWVGAIDFSTLRKIPAEYVSDTRLSRRGDVVWQVRIRDGRHLLVLLEFQSRQDPRMALRILAYTALLYQELDRSKAPVLDERGRLPVVLPVAIYNGEAFWSAVEEMGELVQPVDEVLAQWQPSQRYHVLDQRHVRDEELPDRNLVTAVVRLERMRTPSDLVSVIGMLRDWLRVPEDDELRRVFTDWVRDIARRILPGGAALAPEMTLEDVRMTLVERVAEWPKQWLREGREQGIREGVEQGLAHERALLRRQAASRFGAETAGRLAELLDGIAEPDRLAEIGEWLVRCNTGGEFLSRVTAPNKVARTDA